MKIELSTTRPLAVDSLAPEVTVHTLDDQPIQLTHYWRRSPVLLFFVRHVGCVFCMEQLRLLAHHYADFQSRGADIVAILPVDAISVQRLAQRMKLPFVMLSDLSRRTFAEYGLYQMARSEIFQREALVRVAQQWTQGNITRINPFSSSFTQIGGVFIVDQAGRIALSHAANPMYTYPTIENYLDVFDTLVQV